MIAEDMAFPISPAGNQRSTTPILVGYTPASPIPNKKRADNNESNPVVTPVKAVNSDHHKTILMKTARCPMRSLNTPEGNLNIA